MTSFRDLLGDSGDHYEDNWRIIVSEYIAPHVQWLNERNRSKWFRGVDEVADLLLEYLRAAQCRAGLLRYLSDCAANAAGRFGVLVSLIWFFATPKDRLDLQMIGVIECLYRKDADILAATTNPPDQDQFIQRYEHHVGRLPRSGVSANREIGSNPDRDEQSKKAYRSFKMNSRLAVWGILLVFLTLVGFLIFASSGNEVIVDARVQGRFVLHELHENLRSWDWSHVELEAEGSHERRALSLSDSEHPNGFWWAMPRSASGDCWVHFETENQVLSFRLRETAPESRDEQENAGKTFQLSLSPADWILQTTGLALRVLAPDETRLEPGSLSAGDMIYVLDPSGEEVARVSVHEDQGWIVLPVGTNRVLHYEITDKISGPQRDRLDYLASSHSVVRTALEPKEWKFLVQDEVSHQVLPEGRVLVSHDVITSNPITVGVYGEFEGRQLDYFSRPYGREFIEGGMVKLRPRSLGISLNPLDNWTGEPVEPIHVVAYGGATYLADAQRILLPSPSEVPSLEEVGLEVSSRGYLPRDLRLSEIGAQLGSLGVNSALDVLLEAQLRNIVLVWPASRGMGLALGDQKFKIGEFVAELEASLTEACEPLGYGDIELLVLRDDGLEASHHLENPTYASSDRPDAFFTTPSGWTSSVSIYEDAVYRQRFGRHTVVVAFLGEFSPPRLGVSKGPIRYLHLARWVTDGQVYPPLQSFISENFDGVTNLIVGDSERMKENASLLASDLAIAVKSIVNK